MHLLLRITLVSLVAFSLSASYVFSFSFSEYDENDKGSTTGETAPEPLKCPASFKKMKIATMIGEQHRDDRHGYYGYIITIGEPDWDHRFGTKKSVYGPLVDEFNQNFAQLGLKTFTAAEINDQIVREEQEAVLNNNMEAALSAATRMQADFFLKGIISTRAQTNKMVKVDEVFVTITLTLIDNKGNQLSTAKVSEATFSDADTLGTVQQLVKEQSHEITRQLFQDLCKETN